jgi:hypothetical protein
VKAFNATDGKGDSTEGDPIFVIAQGAIFNILGSSGEKDAKEFLFVPEFTADVIIQTVDLGLGECVRIEAMLEGIGVSQRGTRSARDDLNILVTRRG